MLLLYDQAERKKVATAELAAAAAAENSEYLSLPVPKTQLLLLRALLVCTGVQRG